VADTFYKIRDSRTGLFSTGGSWPSWRKHGKVWTKIGPLRAHLTMMLRCERNMDWWEVVEIETIIKNSRPIHEIIKPERVIEILKQ
jgi:hypothetical protein